MSSTAFMHTCPTRRCLCWPTITFQARPDVQAHLRAGDIQAVIDAWTDNIRRWLTD